MACFHKSTEYRPQSVNFINSYFLIHYRIGKIFIKESEIKENIYSSSQSINLTTLGQNINFSYYLIIPLYEVRRKHSDVFIFV